MAEDISRNGFDPHKGYLGVRLQQGRVWIDADFNEQADIVHHRLKQTVSDLVGATGAPAHGGGFAVQADTVLYFDGGHVAFTAPHRDLHFAEQPFLVEVCCTPSPASPPDPFGGSLLCAADTRGHVHFSLAIDAAGNVIVHRQGELALLAPAHWHGQRRLRVAFDGLSLSVSLDDEHTGHAHAGAPAHEAPNAVFDVLDLDERAAAQRERHLPIGILVGMGMSGGEREDGFRGSIESIRIWAGSTDAAPALVHWRLDEGIGTLAADSSGHGHHLQLDHGERAAHPRWQSRSLSLSPGRFYIDGLVCHSVARTILNDPQPGAANSRGSASLIYLDAWERVVTAAEEPSLRDPALGGVDTAARLRLQQRVRCLPVGSDRFVEPDSASVQRAWRRLLRHHQSGALRVRSTRPARIRDGYYRIEIHHEGGRAEIGEARGRCRVRALEPGGRRLELSGENACAWEIGQYCAALDWRAQITSQTDQGKTLEVSSPVPDSFGTREFWLRPLASFKWSRNNASDQWPVQHAEARGLNVLPVPGRTLAVGDLIEVSDQERRDQGRAGVVSTITQCSDDGQRLVLADPLPALGNALLLTRWHGRALLPASGVWTALENGLEVQFGGPPNHGAGEGWGFATREADGSLDWPLTPTSASPVSDAEPISEATQQRVPAWQPARDGRHHLALLALVQRADSGVSVRDLRRTFTPLTDAGGEAPSVPSRGPAPEPVHRPVVETIRHVGRETQIDDGVIHGRQLAADTGVVPLGAAILSESALPPPGFEATGQTLRVPHPTAAWRPLPGTSPVRHEHVALLEVPNGVLALVPEGRVWLLEAGEQRWRTIAEMPKQLHDFGAAVLRGERLHVVGGRVGNGAPLSTHWVLEHGHWSQRAPLALARASLRLEVLEQRLLALGGSRPGLFPARTPPHASSWWWQREHSTSSVEAYDEGLDAWAPMRSLPVALSDAASVVQDGQLHLIGGRTVPLFGKAKLRPDHFELSANSGQWRRRRPLASAKAGAGAAWLGDALLLVGGESALGRVGDVERYRPAHDRWERSSPLTFGCAHPGVATTLGTLLCAGGETTPTQRDGIWGCGLESLLFVHRRTTLVDLASGHAAPARASGVVPPGAPASPAATAPAANPAAFTVSPQPPAGITATPAATPASKAPAPPGAAAPTAPAPSAPAAHDSPPPSSEQSPPSSTSAVVAPSSKTGTAAQPHPLALPHALSEPALGLSGKLAAARKKVQQALPTLLLAGAAGLLGSGRAPTLLDTAREQLIVWLTPSGDHASASGTHPTSTNTPGTNAGTTAPASQPGSSSSANALSSTDTPHAPTTPSTGALNLGDPSAGYARGVDVSHYQGQVPWESIAYGGVDYAFTKATQGTSYRDPRFSDNWSAMHDHGLLRGAYHVWEPDEDPVAQANFFVSVIGLAGDLPPVIDVELVSRKKKCPELLSDIQTFAETVENQVDQVIAIYSYGDYWQTYLTCDSDSKAAATAKNLALRPLWVADYDNPADPDLFGGHLGWDFWQYTDHGSDRGSQLDLDRFSGGPQDLRRWLARRMRPPVSR